MAGVQVSPRSPVTQSRRSVRLNEKSHRRFSLPSREEVLESISPYDETPSKHYSHLKPRKLVNNFIKERNSYNNPDGIALYDENSDEEFIDDEEDSDDASSVSQEGSDQNSESSEEERGRPGGRLGSKSGNVTSLAPRQRTSTLDNEESDEELAVPLRTNKHRRQLLEQSSSSDEENSQDNGSPVKRKKRHLKKVSIQSDGSSSEDEESPSNPIEETIAPETHQSEEDEQDFNQDEVSLESGESDGSFIATSDSSADNIPVFDYLESAGSSKPTHEELVCNYRQRKSKAARQSQSRKRQRICRPSSSSNTDNEGSGEDGSAPPGEGKERPPSKRAESLSSKKKAWKSETLGRYKEERDRRLSEKKDKTCKIKKEPKS
ncbi:nucleolin 2-like [Asterias rubens]|uniref:nucleolin 2-like n=1 Tax=Asterias rubens TaxID=7604 RepID=UPI0014557B84|nr:nucleolin 2-like [Asterias rubens]XP_033634906.1 nucleolin 2-like [Asterias rubens]